MVSWAYWQTIFTDMGQVPKEVSKSQHEYISVDAHLSLVLQCMRNILAYISHIV